MAPPTRNYSRAQANQIQPEHAKMTDAINILAMERRALRHQHAKKDYLIARLRVRIATLEQLIPIPNHAPRDKSTVTCYECGVTGHYSSKCPMKAANTAPRTGSNAVPVANEQDKSTITCYECGVVGHYSNECPKKLAKIAANTAAPTQQQRHAATRRRHAEGLGPAAALVVPGSTVLPVSARQGVSDVNTFWHARWDSRRHPRHRHLHPRWRKTLRSRTRICTDGLRETWRDQGNPRSRTHRLLPPNPLPWRQVEGFHTGALDGVDLSPRQECTGVAAAEINYMVAHSLHRHSESLVNTLERVALRVVKEIMSHRYSPSGPALGTFKGEMPLQPQPFAWAAPELPNSSAYVVYKIGGDPSDYQFLHEAPKEIPHGYSCAYVPDCNAWALSNQAAISGASGTAGGTSRPILRSNRSTPSAITADQICAILKDQFGMMPKRKAFGYTKPYPNSYELIRYHPYRLRTSTVQWIRCSSSIEHVSDTCTGGTISASGDCA
ncbi:hypothetical protein QYE76_001861 [Lolium multiflorum]|uniref:CCHC-type domain-containing protein n=1 Tax=Lolium multiflorum TaxID=4521 RepID=A0AAD8RKH6_LOLMU|nr:hypothetical protein QYE76_001861 [Lolium multiflorum]